jgi:hypothetical protein
MGIEEVVVFKRELLCEQKKVVKRNKECNGMENTVKILQNTKTDPSQ